MEIDGLVTGLLLGGSLLMLGFGLKKPLVGGAAALIVFLVTLLSKIAGFVFFPIGAFALLMAMSPNGSDTPGRQGTGYCVTACAGPLAGRQFYLTERSPILDFGRGNDCSVRVPADTKGVSTHHCRLTLQNGRVYLSDSGSTYGTFYGNPIRRLTPQSPAELGNGSEFWLASNQIVFRINRIN